MDNEILELAKQILNCSEIKNYEIPDINLYMDQVTSFMDSKLKNFKRNENDIILTKTMINNYTKNKLITPPVKKRYSKENLMMLIFIYHLKQSLSISDIGSLMNFIVDNDKSTNLEELYNDFVDIEKNTSTSFIDNLNSKINFIKETNDKNHDRNEKLFLLVIELILSANIEKRMAEKIIDTYFQTDDGK